MARLVRTARRTTTVVGLLCAAVLAATLAGCHRSEDVTLPPTGAEWDYQIGGGYTLPAGATVVSRDSTDSPAAGAYNICYVNGFQTQPGEADWWLTNHPDLVLRTPDGEPFVDPDWPDEYLLDTTTEDKRLALALIMNPTLDACLAAGFDAVEVDNLDTFTRSGGLLSEDDAVAYIRRLADYAHHIGLAIAQKNTVEVLDRRAETDLDFAIAEGCNRWSECHEFTAVYGDDVFVVEYRRQDFDTGCADWPGLAIVLRDRDVTTPSQSGYVHDAC